MAEIKINFDLQEKLENNQNEKKKNRFKIKHLNKRNDNFLCEMKW